MVYTIDVLFALLTLLTGLSASWIAVELARLTAFEPSPAGASAQGPASRAIALAATAFLGPRLLIANGFQRWREGGLSLGLYALVVAIACGWATLAGVVVLQLAFASGFFLA